MPTDSPLAGKFVQARNYREGRSSKVRLLAIHTMEYPERPTGAEWCADYFAGPRAPMASTHYCCDNDSVVQGVREADTAYTTPGANHDGISIEHAGHASQKDDATGWRDAYSTALLDRSARLAADICKRNSIPIRHLTDAQLRAGDAGIIGHDQATRVYRRSSHTDPGKGFPWDRYIALVQAYANPKPKPPAPSLKPAPARVLNLGSRGDDVKRMQQGMQKIFPTYAPRAADGSYGPDTMRAIREFQTRTGITVDGITGPGTRAALGKHGVRF